MHAITACSLTVQKIEPLPSQTAVTDQPQISYRLNRGEGTVSLIIRGGNQFDDMSAMFAFYSGSDKSRPYVFEPSDGVLKTRCHLKQNGEIGIRVVVGPVTPDRPAASGDLSSNVASLPPPRLRDRVNGEAEAMVRRMVEHMTSDIAPVRELPSNFRPRCDYLTLERLYIDRQYARPSGR